MAQDFARLKNLLFGKPKNLNDQSIFHRLSLIPFLAWVGLGADGLSSSAYGPEEAFKALGEHRYMAIGLALLTAFTVFIISAAYRRIIEEFPHGGGGYVVASKLLGRRFGVVSGCALLVDYILTITISVAAAGDALFSFLPLHMHIWKMSVEIFLILALTTLNIRGVKESVLVLAPVFMIFLITHIMALCWGIFSHLSHMPEMAHSVTTGFQSGVSTLGVGALFLLFVHAYSLGGGTYTGIEAVSNGLPIMRDPKVATAKRTMTYMAVSLALTAAGLLLCYLLWNVPTVEGKTLNAALFEKMVVGIPFGLPFVVVALFSEGALLIVAAQAGFIDGPRVLANMAVDSWVPRRFAALSERLTTSNGILLMGATSLLALVYTHGNVASLVVMYSINVFLTFSLSIFGMLKLYVKNKESKPGWFKNTALFSVGFVLCVTILVITVFEKFAQGGWLTLLITGSIVLLCFYIRAHYLDAAKKLTLLYTALEKTSKSAVNLPFAINPKEKTAVILVSGYGGLGIHTVHSITKTFPGVFKNFIFLSISVVDSGGFKGKDSIDRLKMDTEEMLAKYVKFANSFGLAADFRTAIGTDVVHEAFQLCARVSQEFPQATFFTGKVIFSYDKWYHRFLHNETGMALQKRLQLAGLTMVILPAKVA